MLGPASPVPSMRSTRLVVHAQHTACRPCFLRLVLSRSVTACWRSHTIQRMCASLVEIHTLSPTIKPSVCAAEMLPGMRVSSAIAVLHDAADRCGADCGHCAHGAKVS